MGRSQMAEGLCKALIQEHQVASAGVKPPKDWLGRSLKDTEFVAKCMKEIGINVDEHICKKITPKIAESADKIVVIGEKRYWPEYLKKRNKQGDVVFWNVEDPDTKIPQRMEDYRTARDKIEKLVKELITELDKK